jgi:hypothetical protein
MLNICKISNKFDLKLATSVFSSIFMILVGGAQFRERGERDEKASRLHCRAQNHAHRCQPGANVIKHFFCL